jgi:uncharacterized protein
MLYIGRGTTAMANPVTWFEIYGKDGAKLQQFYKDLFDWKINANNPMNYGMVEAEQGGIGGGISGGEGPAGVYINIEVSDLQAYLDKAVSLGAEVVMPVTVIPDMVTFAQFRDPQGNVIGIVQSQNAQ